MNLFKTYFKQSKFRNNFHQKIYYIFLISIFIFYLTILFHRLPFQEFSGDEASPMYLIDRMWDALSFKDIRYLGFPYLFYHDPYRALISGTLLHFFGPDPTLIRLPNIFFAILTFISLLIIFSREKVKKWIILLTMFSFTISGITINSRIAGGDAQTRFLILICGYLIYKTWLYYTDKNIRLILLTLVSGILTMLDSVVIIPAFIALIWKSRHQISNNTKLLIILSILILITYFALWIILPQLAFHNKYQDFLSNRGFFYYFSRVNQGISNNFLESFYLLYSKTSLGFIIWISSAFITSLFVKKLRLFSLIIFPAWIAVTLLTHPSYHINMYMGLFFVQAVLFTNYIHETFSKLKFFLILFLILIIISNIFGFKANYSYYYAPDKNINHAGNNCLSEATIRIYNKHFKTPINADCNLPNL